MWPRATAQYKAVAKRGAFRVSVFAPASSRILTIRENPRFAATVTTGSNWCRLINELRKTRLDRSAGCGGNCTLFADLCYGEW